MHVLLSRLAGRLNHDKIESLRHLVTDHIVDHCYSDIIHQSFPSWDLLPAELKERIQAGVQDWCSEQGAEEHFPHIEPDA